MVRGETTGASAPEAGGMGRGAGSCAAKVGTGATCPAGPIMLTTSAPVKEVGSMSRSNTTSTAVTVVFFTRLSLVAGWLGTLVLMMCGPGTISGRVDESNGGTK